MRKGKRIGWKRWAACLMTGVILAGGNTIGVRAEEEQPQVNFEHLSIGSVDGKTGMDGYPYNCIYSDLIYIEYPGSFRFGSVGTCPLAFFYPQPNTGKSNEFKTFQDSNLVGSMETVAAYIKSGGINKYLSEVIGASITEEYQFVTESEDSEILVYWVKKGSKQVASVVVWTQLGQVSIRSEIRESSYRPADDRGKIMIMPERDHVDFSSADAIRSYIDSGYLLDDTSVFSKIETYGTEFHEYVLCEGEADGLKMAVYIPVTPADKKKWIVVFAISSESKQTVNAYEERDTIMKTFRVLK